MIQPSSGRRIRARWSLACRNAPTPSAASGYWLLRDDGVVMAYGTAARHGDTGGSVPDRIVGMTYMGLEGLFGIPLDVHSLAMYWNQEHFDELQAVIAARIDHLVDPARDLVRKASVFARTSFEISDLALWGVPFGLVGGRLYHVITDNRRESSISTSSVANVDPKRPISRNRDCRIPVILSRASVRLAIGGPIRGFERLDEAMARAREVLEPADFDAAWRDGAASMWIPASRKRSAARSTSSRVSTQKARWWRRPSMRCASAT